jgi:hypothetical protein
VDGESIHSSALPGGGSVQVTQVRLLFSYGKSEPKRLKFSGVSTRKMFSCL